MIWGGGENREIRFEGPSPGKKSQKNFQEASSGKKLISKGLAEKENLKKAFPTDN